MIEKSTHCAISHRVARRCNVPMDANAPTIRTKNATRVALSSMRRSRSSFGVRASFGERIAIARCRMSSPTMSTAMARKNSVGQPIELRPRAIRTMFQK